MKNIANMLENAVFPGTGAGFFFRMAFFVAAFYAFAEIGG